MARSYLGLLITGLTSFLFFYLGQAHLTSEFTPDLARNIEGWSVGCSEAWWWFALDAESVRTFSPAPSCLPYPRSRSLLFSTSCNQSNLRQLWLALSLILVTQILRDLRPDHSWSPHRPPNFSKSNAASTWIHVFGDIRSVGKWMGIVTGDGRSGYADLGIIDKIEKRKWEMHNFGVGIDYQSRDMDILAVFADPIAFLA
jgi:hypothetical protein